jgi:hypothetical protein
LFSGQDRANEDLVLELLRRSLNWDVTRSYVLEEIHVWVKFTDNNPAAFRSLGRLIWRMVLKGKDSPREIDRICKHLNRWATDEKSNTANRLLVMLKEYSLV